MIEKRLSFSDSHQRASVLAERFCRGLIGPRARYVFGINRPMNVPTVWQAVCTRAMGYFTERGESEIIPESVTLVHAIAELRTVSE